MKSKPQPVQPASAAEPSEPEVLRAHFHLDTGRTTIVVRVPGLGDVEMVNAIPTPTIFQAVKDMALVALNKRLAAQQPEAV